MPIFKDNVTRVETTALSDAAGALITTGTVELAIQSLDRATELLAPQAMTHIAAGVWRYDLTVAQVNALGQDRVRLVVTVGNPASASFERVEVVTFRERVA